MDRILRAIVIITICFSGAITSNGQAGKQDKAELKSLKKTREIKELKKEAGKKSIKDEKVRNEKGAIWVNGLSPEPVDPPLDHHTNFTDPGKQSGETNIPGNPAANVVTSINGLPYTNVVPPDPTMAVGPNHIIQMINGTSGSLFRVINKTGTILIPATFMDQVTGIGGFADPIALYDHLADRFVMMEMVNSTEAGSYGLSFAVSKTGDPTGAWDVFFLSTGTNLPDYPKLSIWPDAYYITANEFTNASSYAGTFAYAIERNAILQGLASPQALRIRLGQQFKHISACPVTLQGNPSGSGSNGLIAWMQDDVWSTWDANDGDSIGLFKFNVNWSNPSLSNISNVSSLVTVPYKSNVCTASRGRCIPQTGTTAMLEALHQKIMNQPVYRAFAGYEGVVMTHATDAGNEQSGIRWYELRKNNETPNWVIGQQSTYSPDGTSRFMSTISYNHRGDIALAYNVSDSTGIYPGIRFTGRRSCDPANIMTVSETNIKAGVSFSGSTRFGDYNHMVADPVNGNFWATGSYMTSFQWATHIAQISMDTCAAVCGTPSGLLTKNLTPTSVTLAWTEATGVNFYEVEYKQSISPAWITGSTTTADSFNLSSLLPGTSYSWRVRSGCDFENSSWVTGSFSTPVPVCNIPANLLTSQISHSAATFSWTKIAEATDYILEYQATGSTTWIDLPVIAADTIYILPGLSPSTGYNWRVKTVCSSTLQSDWANQSFATLAEICNPPSALQTTSITPFAAGLNWVPSGTNQPTEVEYQVLGAQAWNAVTVNPGTTFFNLTGLIPSTTYNWRVRNTCNTVTSNWASQTFATTAEICNPPTGLQTTSITPFAARLNWVPSGTNQPTEVEYQVSGAQAWNTVTVNPGATFYNLTGLIPSTTYNWRVRNTCNTVTSNWASQTFATTAEICNPPSGLQTTSITPFAARLNWVPSGTNQPTEVEYQVSGAQAWNTVTVNPGTTFFNLTGLIPSTTYNWRVRNTCTTVTSNWASQTFATNAEICNPPSGLQTTLITSNSARLNWQPAVANLNQQLEYQVAGNASWVNIPVTAGTNTFTLSGLSPLTSYNWRVRTICTAVQSTWAAQSFATIALAVTLCQPPASLSASDITAGSAQLNWGVVQGATAYRVEFQKVGATTWTLLSAATTGNSVFLSGLTASTSYNWRVSATCPQNTTGFSQASFTTTGSCTTPASLVTSNITSNSATVGWASIKGVTGYRVEYKTAAAATWIVLPNTTAKNLTLTGLISATAYQWRVRTICTAGPSAPSATQNFTTFGPPCPDPYEPNNSKSALAAIPVKTDIFAAIGSSSDQDWFSFNNTSAERNIRITLSQLPANYSITLYGPDGRSVVKAAKTGLVDEIISYNTTTVGKYWIQVFPASTSVFDPSKCYKLRVNIQSGTNSPEIEYTEEIIYTLAGADISETEKVQKETWEGSLLLYPNPAKDRLNVQLKNPSNGKTFITVLDQTGRALLNKQVQGAKTDGLDISRLPAGMYLLKVETGNQTIVRKFMVNR